jgi:SAM-dependent methyltransferase
VSEPVYLDSVRTSYDTVAANYAHELRDYLAEEPYDRAMLGLFAELDPGGGPVADIGCGPGRITTYLASLGLDAFGVDLSPEMVAQARSGHPSLRFAVGSMTALDLPDASLCGIVAWFSIIHTPTELLPTVFAEFGRVLRPGAELILAFQTGDEVRHIDQAYGHPVSIDVILRPVDLVASLLHDVGLSVHTRVRCEPKGRERGPHAYLMARSH